MPVSEEVLHLQVCVILVRRRGLEGRRVSKAHTHTLHYTTGGYGPDSIITALSFNQKQSDRIG